MTYHMGSRGKRTEFKASLHYIASSKSAGVPMRLSQRTKTLRDFSLLSDQMNVSTLCFLKPKCPTLTKWNKTLRSGWDSTS